MTDSEGPEAYQEPPWWHSTPQEPPVDSVMAEGLKLAAALRDWAVESGAVATAAGFAQSAAVNASAYLAAVQAPADEVDGAEDAEEVEVTVRCADCPVCQGLDALESANPQLAQKARVALAGVNAALMGFLRTDEGD